VCILSAPCPFLSLAICGGWKILLKESLEKYSDTFNYEIKIEDGFSLRIGLQRFG
jgi:hypothetical protein